MSFNLNTVTVLVGGLQYVLSNLPAGTQEELQMLNELQDLSDTHAFESSMYGEKPKSERLLSLESKVGAQYLVWKSIQIGYSPFSEELLDSINAQNLSYYRQVESCVDGRTRMQKIFDSLKASKLYCDWDTQTVYVAREFDKNGNPTRLEKYDVQQDESGSWIVGYSYVCASEQMWDVHSSQGLKVDHLAKGFWQTGFPVDSFGCRRKAKKALRAMPRQLRRYM